MTKPTLQEIADMPFPQSEDALFDHYGVRPKRTMPEDPVKTFEVTVRYSYRISESETYEIDARDADEAEEIAEVRFGNGAEPDAEIDEIEVIELEE